MHNALAFVYRYPAFKLRGQPMHLKINNGRVYCGNETMIASAPIALDLDCIPEAAPFIRAVDKSDQTAQMHLTPEGALSIRAGNFQALITTIEKEAFEFSTPEGLRFPSRGEWLPALKTLLKFVSNDAGKQWANSIQINGAYGYATNNVILIEHALPFSFPYKINLPRQFVKEVLKTNLEPQAVQLSAETITFHYENGYWLKTKLNVEDWPDVEQIFSQVKLRSETKASLKPLWKALHIIKPFIDKSERVYLFNDYIATDPQKIETSAVTVPGLQANGIFNVAMLQSLEQVADFIGFENYPNPVPFHGNKTRGLILGFQ